MTAGLHGSVQETSTILLVEDNADDVDLVTYAFRKLGIRNPIAVVGDGDAAVAYIQGTGVYGDRARHPLPVLVLLDLKLPRRSGFEVLQEIRRESATRHTPVVVLTSSGQDADVLRAYELTANSYLVKPVSRDGLVAMLQSVQDYWIKLNRTV
ncbi:MAG: response regulator [Gemmatimonas sp.]